MNTRWQINDLHFGHPGRWLFSGLNLELAPGLTWLQGPNGSGKSSLLRLLAGVLAPARGRLVLAGVDAAADPIGYRRNLFWCGPDGIALDHLKGHEYLALLRTLFPCWQAERLPACIEALALGVQLDKPIRALSTGTQRKLQLAAALVAATPAVLLDEPLNALDQNARPFVLRALATAAQGPQIWLVASHEALPDSARTMQLP